MTNQSSDGDGNLWVTVALIGLVTVTFGPLLLGILARQFFAEARYVASGAMAPALQVDDRILINKMSYRSTEPARGDIILFWPPEEAVLDPGRRDAFVKRVIGLPGETVAISNSSVLIDSAPLDEAYIQQPAPENWGPETVPENAYFVLGDNRIGSFDSRYWGFVPRDQIIGRVSAIYWPPDRSATLPNSQALPVE